MKKLVVLEPLGVSEQDLETWIREALGSDLGVVLYNERAKSDEGNDFQS